MQLDVIADPAYEVQRQIAFIHRRWRARFDQRLRETGVTEARWHVLLVLSISEGGLLQRELAERVGIEASTLVRQLDDLQRDGLIVREPVDGDRRANLVRLAPAAEPLIEKITGVADLLRDEILSGIARDDLVAALSVLRLISARLE